MRPGSKSNDAAQQLAELAVQKTFASDAASQKLGMQVDEVHIALFCGTLPCLQNLNGKT